jgi:hypothetical protein
MGWRDILTSPQERISTVSDLLVRADQQITILLRDQGVPLVEKTRLQRLQGDLVRVRSEVDPMVLRSGRSGWQVVKQEGESHDDSASSGCKASEKGSGDQPTRGTGG